MKCTTDLIGIQECNYIYYSRMCFENQCWIRYIVNPMLFPLAISIVIMLLSTLVVIKVKGKIRI